MDGITVQSRDRRSEHDTEHGRTVRATDGLIEYVRTRRHTTDETYEQAVARLRERLDAGPLPETGADTDLTPEEVAAARQRVIDRLRSTAETSSHRRGRT